MKIDHIIFFFFSFNGNSCDTTKTNSDIEIIRQIFESYKQCTLKEDYAASFDLIYPEVFKGTSKKEKIESIKKGMHNANYDIIIKEIYVDSVYKPEKYGSNKYSLISARTKARFSLKQIPVDSFLFNGMCDRAKSQVGDQNVSCDLKNGSIDMIQKANTYFIFDHKLKKWFMLGDNDPQDVEKFIPLEVRQRFGVN